MRVLVCGSRDFGWPQLVEMYLDHIAQEGAQAEEETVIIEGGAKGADAHAARWVEKHPSVYVEHEQYPADWDLYGKRAGIERNELMLREGKPDLVLAFVNKDLEESRGTAHMVGIARKAGVTTLVTDHRLGQRV